MRGGGSSTALSSALDACSVSRSASSMSTTCQRPSDGRRAAGRRPARISATEIDSPSGTTECTSGWLRVSDRAAAPQHSPQPRGSRSHCSAAANARAATERPEPAGPVNSQACVIAPASRAARRDSAAAAAAAACSVATASSWPISSSQTLTPLPDQRHPCGHRRSRGGGAGRAARAARRPRAGRRAAISSGGGVASSDQVAARVGLGQHAERRAAPARGTPATRPRACRPTPRRRRGPGPPRAGTSSSTVRSGAQTPVAHREMPRAPRRRVSSRPTPW